MEDKMFVRNLTKAILVLTLMLLLVVPGFSQKMKMGYVDTQKLATEFKEFQDAQKKLDEVIRQWENEGLEMQQRYQQLREQYDAQSLVLSETRKKEKQQEIEALLAQLQKFQRDKFDPQAGEVLKKQAEFVQPVYDKIKAVITKIGDAEKFDLVLDINAAGVLYKSENLIDITDQVLAELNKGQTVKTEESPGKDK